jgi:hypothetical protein
MQRLPPECEALETWGAEQLLLFYHIRPRFITKKTAAADAATVFSVTSAKRIFYICNYSAPRKKDQNKGRGARSQELF